MVPARLRRFEIAMVQTLVLLIAPVACALHAPNVKSVVRNAGSDTMVNLAQMWAEVYSEVRPGVSVEVSGGGSATGIAAMIEGAADVANCSRQMEPEEIEMAVRQTGTKPVEWVVGYDALAVFVHRGNPLESISLEELAEMYGRQGRFTRWSDLGVKIPGAVTDDIILISRQSNSGTYEYFRDAILGSADFRMGTRDLNGSKEVVALIGSTPSAIGYSGMGYATPEVKMLKISRKKGGEAFAPNVRNALSGNYPIARPLYMYTLGQPAGALSEYLDWIRGAHGQQIVRQTGYVPLRDEEEPAVRPAM